MLGLAPDTTYYLAIEPASGSDVRLLEFGLPSSLVLPACAGGAEFFSASRTTLASGAFTDDTSSVPLLEPLISGIETSGGGGGQTIIHSGRGAA